VIAGELATEADAPHYVLRLCVAGSTPRSARAIVNIRKLCDDHLKGNYELEIVDLSLQPELAAAEQILAAPTLLKKLPLPLRRFIGDMSRTEHILHGMGLVLQVIQVPAAPPSN
jgi:circadian clock protein KaiB